MNWEALFVGRYRRLCPPPVPPFHCRFYPYARLTHTIRRREGKIWVRISDLLEGAPEGVLAATLDLLLSRLHGLPQPQGAQQVYREYVERPPFQRRLREVRAQRGRKVLSSPRGKVYDLEELFRALNRRFFSGGLRLRHLSWSRRPNRRTLGHYDEAHEAIVIDRRLDNPLVPRYVIEYVLYHEMLHLALGERRRGGRRCFHHPEFRRAEKAFPHYQRARRFLQEALC